MKKTFFVCVVVMLAGLTSCSIGGRTIKVVRPRYHKVYPTQVWRVDIPIGARHIRFLGRKRTKVVNLH